MAARSPSINFLSRPARAKKRYERARGKRKEEERRRRSERARPMRFYRLFSVHIHAFLFPFARPSFASHLRALPTVSSLSIVQFRRVLEYRLSPGNTRFRPISSLRNLRLLGQSIFKRRRRSERDQEGFSTVDRRARNRVIGSNGEGGTAGPSKRRLEAPAISPESPVPLRVTFSGGNR